MADKENDGPPPLEDPNSPDYVCVVCQNNVDALCQECQAIAELRANSTRNDSGGEESPVTTRSNSPKAMSASGTNDSAYSADTIIDSPTSTDTTVDMNDIDFGAENNLNYNRDEPHIIHNFDESCLLYPPCCCHIPNPSEDSDDEI